MPTPATEPTPPATAPDVREVRCLEVWGGTEAVERTLSVPGIDLWISSHPYAGEARGGDIHYVSSCFTGRVARLAVADVSGHGESVGELAATLRRLMRKHINYLDQSAFARVLNEKFQVLASGRRFATAVLVSYFAPTDHLIVCNAGHPPPLWYRAAEDRWQWLDDQTPECCAAPTNLPLGIVEPTDYTQFVVPLAPDDLVLLYTDSLTEAKSADGRMMGMAGLLEAVGRLPIAPPEAFGRQVLDAVAAYRGHADSEDDQTLIVLHHNASEVPRRPVRGAIRALGELLGLAGD